MSRRRKHIEEVEADERWVISYADLVTLLFGFFILLYATADQNIVKFESLARGLSEAFNVPVNEGIADGTPLWRAPCTPPPRWAIRFQPSCTKRSRRSWRSSTACVPGSRHGRKRPST